MHKRCINDPAQAEDFRTVFEENPRRFKNKPTAMVCKGCGISVYTDLQDIKRLKDRYKGKFGKYKIAEGELDAKFGTIQNTPSKENLIILGGCLLEQNLGPFLA